MTTAAILAGTILTTREISYAEFKASGHAASSCLVRVGLRTRDKRVDLDLAKLQ
jgi:hypothetical protein